MFFRQEDPRRCTIGVALSFLQDSLERRLSPTTLKVYVAAIGPITMQWTAGQWESMTSPWGFWGVPGGWIPLGHPWCPHGSSPSSWLAQACVLPWAKSPVVCTTAPGLGQSISLSPHVTSLCRAVTINRKELKLSFTEGRNPFRILWGKEQRLDYLQQRCTPYSLRAPRLANLRWGDGKVATFHMEFVCHALAGQYLHVTGLWQDSGCGTFHRTPISPRHNSEWPTDRERLGYVRNPRSLMERTEMLCPHAIISNHRLLPGTWYQVLSGKSDEWMHLLPFYTRMHGELLRYATSTSQYSLAFSLKVRDDWGSQVNPYVLTT